MILLLDAHYEPSAVVTAGVVAASWSEAEATFEVVERSAGAAAPYAPGQFYEREMPHLLAVIGRVQLRYALETIVVDGHVWLGAGRPGLGAHLHSELGGRVAVVGVAKAAFRGGAALPVLRGRSRRPLFVTAAGMDAARAAALVGAMHGANRIPTLLQRADRLARMLELPRLT